MEGKGGNVGVRVYLNTVYGTVEQVYDGLKVGSQKPVTLLTGSTKSTFL